MSGKNGKRSFQLKKKTKETSKNDVTCHLSPVEIFHLRPGTFYHLMRLVGIYLSKSAVRDDFSSRLYTLLQIQLCICIAFADIFDQEKY